ncbi:TonB-dependent receptor [Maribacter sp. 2307ULW6-5]|uniref:TonB-dependent receptor n=1 Tax=Maribacter sp. 2307ULW6-5 TaxID=3386275 RepID=UPI0039BC3901
MRNIITAMILFPLWLSCKGVAIESPQKSPEKKATAQSNLTLLDRLKSVSGIAVQRGGVVVRGQVGQRSGATAATKPLFVVDGQRIGNDIGIVQGLVDTNDIVSVEVVKGAATVDYGLQGSGGVVLIKTKKN